MENNWPETIDELLDECQQLISRYDLYTLGKYGKPFTGETKPRVDGTEYLAGEYQYGVAMIPAQWVTHVIEAATHSIHADCADADWQAIADELNGMLGSDNEYEAKMDALLCRLTNGKWSKSRAYSLDFMVSCVDEEYEDAYEKEHAELGSSTLTAEQVRKVLLYHLPHREYYSVEQTDAWQAIADELNAELGGGECEFVIEDNMNESEGMGDVKMGCESTSTTQTR